MLTPDFAGGTQRRGGKGHAQQHRHHGLGSAWCGDGLWMGRLQAAIDRDVSTSYDGNPVVDIAIEQEFTSLFQCDVSVIRC